MRNEAGTRPCNAAGDSIRTRAFAACATQTKNNVQKSKFILMHAEENNGAKNKPQVPKSSEYVTTDEKAQYEVFRNGEIPRDTIEEWVKNDLKATLSFIHGCLNDKKILTALVDSFFERYQSLHNKQEENVEKTAN